MLFRWNSAALRSGSACLARHDDFINQLHQKLTPRVRKGVVPDLRKYANSGMRRLLKSSWPNEAGGPNARSRPTQDALLRAALPTNFRSFNVVFAEAPERLCRWTFTLSSYEQLSFYVAR